MKTILAVLAVLGSSVSASAGNPNLSSIPVDGWYLTTGGLPKNGGLGSLQVFTDTSKDMVTLVWKEKDDQLGKKNVQVYSCQNVNEPCTILEDSLGYAKTLTVHSDGSMSYLNSAGHSRALVPQSPIDKLIQDAYDNGYKTAKGQAQYVPHIFAPL